MREIFVSTTFIRDKTSVFKAIKLLKKIKVKNIELGSNHIYEKSFIELKNYKFNFFVHNYFPVPKKDFVINIASINEKIRKKSIRQIKKSILFTKFIGGGLYTFHPGFYSDPKGARLNDKNYDFLWNKKRIDRKLKKDSYRRMIISIKEIVKFSKKNKVRIAIETEGSIKAKDHLMMQLPSEYKNFKKSFSPKELGINLNLAHLNLASKTFKFDKKKFINSIKKYLVAVELSHNYKNEDSHKPIKKGSWYISFIKKNVPQNIPIILEFRNSKINEIINSINLIKRTN
tara:strand:+ start:8399 stop:9259 length:861 start_codon:yes stop_codon:yes gene_type:complete